MVHRPPSQSLHVRCRVQILIASANVSVTIQIAIAESDRGLSKRRLFTRNVRRLIAQIVIAMMDEHHQPWERVRSLMATFSTDLGVM